MTQTFHFIETDDEYKLALGRAMELMDATPDTPDGDELLELSTVIEVYENEKWPMDGAPGEGVGLTVVDCSPQVGG